MGFFKKKKTEKVMSKEEILEYLSERWYHYSDELIKPYIDDKDFLMKAVEYGSGVWKFFPESDRNNPEFALDILQKRSNVWKELPAEMKSEAFIEKALDRKDAVWESMTDEERNIFCKDKEKLFSFCKRNIKKNSRWDCYIYRCSEEIADENKILELLDIKSVVFKYLPHKFTYKGSFLEKALEVNAGLYYYFSEDQRKIYDDYLNLKKDDKIKELSQELSLLKAEIKELRLALPKTYDKGHKDIKD